MFIWENGITLTERLVPQGLSNAATAVVKSLKINSITEKLRKGRRVVVKRRNVHGEQMADLANFYFRLRSIPIRFLSKAKDWPCWEIKCFNMLNGIVSGVGLKPTISRKLQRESFLNHRLMK